MRLHEVDARLVPLVQVERADLGDMDTQTSVNAGTLDAKNDAQIDTRPLKIWTGACVRESKVRVCVRKPIATIFIIDVP